MSIPALLAFFSKVAMVCEEIALVSEMVATEVQPLASARSIQASPYASSVTLVLASHTHV